MTDAEGALGRDLREALAACRFAMASTRASLTETARREVHMYLASELRHDAAADEWYEAALAPKSLVTPSTLEES
jgi:hypothetical protein